MIDTLKKTLKPLMKIEEAGRCKGTRKHAAENERGLLHG